MDNKKGKCCGCPAQMSDGNFVTNYRSARNIINKQIKKNNGIGDHHSYRNYLQKNTNQIIAKQAMFLEKNMKCNFNRQEIKVKKAAKKPTKVGLSNVKVQKPKPKPVKKVKSPKKVTKPVKKVKKPVTTSVKSKTVTQKVVTNPTSKSTTTVSV